MTQYDGPIPVEGGPRCHVNIAVWDMRDDLEAYRVYPDTPARVFAGDEGPNFVQTVFLRFDDEATMAAVLDPSPSAE